MTFQYKVSRSGSKPTASGKPQVYKPQEVLEGTLQGKKVPQDEERFYRGAMRTGKVRGYYVQFEIGARGLPGYRTLDALISTDMGWRAVEVDGASFVHRGDAAKANDRLADYQRMDGLRRLGIVPMGGIEHLADSKLQTQEQADRTAKDFFA